MKLNHVPLLITFLLFTLGTIEAQEVPELNFEQFEPYLTKDNDTTYIINFWATWCKPCIDELPEFIETANERKNEKLKFIFVSLDFPNQVENRLKPFVTKNKMEGMVILLNDPNSNSWIEKVDKNWSGAIPATVIYKSKQKSFFERTLTYDELNKEINLKQVL